MRFGRKNRLLKNYFFSYSARFPVKCKTDIILGKMCIFLASDHLLLDHQLFKNDDVLVKKVVSYVFCGKKWTLIRILQFFNSFFTILPFF